MASVTYVTRTRLVLPDRSTTAQMAPAIYALPALLIALLALHPAHPVQRVMFQEKAQPHAPHVQQEPMKLITHASLAHPDMSPNRGQHPAHHAQPEPLNRKTNVWHAIPDMYRMRVLRNALLVQLAQ